MYGCPQADSLTGQGTGQCPAEDTEVRKRTVLMNANYRELTVN